MSVPSVLDVLGFLEKKAPAALAEAWDNVGLLLGDPKAKIKGAVLSIDLTREAIDAALKSGFHLIITHHPCIFPAREGLRRVVPETQGGADRLIYDVLRAGVAVIAAHTNFDKSSLEVVEKVSSALGVRPSGRLFEEFQSVTDGFTSGQGYGFWGSYNASKPFLDVARSVKEAFCNTQSSFLCTDPPPRSVSRMGFVAGKGSAFLPHAVALGCDLFVTGEAGYHASLYGKRNGICVIELGHRESEKFFTHVVGNWLRAFGIDVVESDVAVQKIFLIQNSVVPGSECV